MAKIERESEQIRKVARPGFMRDKSVDSRIVELWHNPLAIAEHQVYLLTKAGFRLHVGTMQVPERYHPAVWKIIATCSGFLAFGFGAGILAGLDIPN